MIRISLTLVSRVLKLKFITEFFKKTNQIERRGAFVKFELVKKVSDTFCELMTQCVTEKLVTP